MNGSHIQLED